MIFAMMLDWDMAFKANGAGAQKNCRASGGEATRGKRYLG